MVLCSLSGLMNERLKIQVKLSSSLLQTFIERCNVTMIKVFNTPFLCKDSYLYHMTQCYILSLNPILLRVMVCSPLARLREILGSWGKVWRLLCIQANSQKYVSVEHLALIWPELASRIVA